MADVNAEELAEALDTDAAPQAEAPAEEPKEEKGLSLDEALQAAYDKHEKGIEPAAAPKSSSAKGANDTGLPPAKAEAAGETQTETPQRVEAPQEFSARGRDAWAKGDLKSVREEMQRVLKDRQAEVTRVHNEYMPYRGLVEQVQPYLAAAGNTGKPPVQAITEAVALAQHLKKDPLGFVREVAAHGKYKPEQIFGAQRDEPVRPEISALQSQVHTLTSKLEARDTETLGRQYGAIFSDLQASGKYPDLTDDESGIRMASQIGTLTRSPDFVRAVRAINPSAGLAELTIKAYATLGGRIVEPTISSSSTKPQHIEKARRASASVPGRAPASAKAAPQKKYGDLGSALKAALEFHSE
jgi:hypothetical protein